MIGVDAPRLSPDRKQVAAVQRACHGRLAVSDISELPATACRGPLTALASVVTTTTAVSILIVEDDSLLRHAFRLLLEDAGYEVREAGSAREALAAVARQAPALILLDLGLPDRPGLEVARALTGDPDTRHIPVVALTGRVGPEERRACLEAGCKQYLAKPVEPRELIRRLPGLLGIAS